MNNLEDRALPPIEILESNQLTSAISRRMVVEPVIAVVDVHASDSEYAGPTLRGNPNRVRLRDVTA